MFRKNLSRFRKKFLPLLGVLGVVVFVGMIFPGVTKAADLGFSKALIGVIGEIGSMILKLLGTLLGILIEQLVGLFSFNNFVNLEAPPAVHIGWTIVRDLSNMMFIIALMVIAFGTILKIQSYHARSLLVKMIIMAVLINFSKTITGMFIDAAQVIMLTFVGAFKDSAPIVLTVGLNLAQMTSFAQDTDGLKGFFSVLAAIFLANAMLVVAIAVIIAMLIIIVARILMLWILVILSPVAFIASVLPNTSRYASQWWQSLGKNLISGPILAFFLWLSLSIISTSAGMPINLSELEGGGGGDLGGTIGAIETDGKSADLPKGATAIMTTQNMFNYIITIALLITGIMLTQQLGVMGGSTLGSFPGKLKSMGVGAFTKPFSVGWRVTQRPRGAIGRKIQEKVPIVSPAFWKGMGERGRKLKEIEDTKTAGKGEEAMEKIMQEWVPGMGDRLKNTFKGYGLFAKTEERKGAAFPRAEEARRKVINQRISDINQAMGSSTDAKEKMMEFADRGWKQGGTQGEDTRMAILEMATGKGNMDDVFTHFMDHYVKTEQDAKEWGFEDKKDEEGNVVMTGFEQSRVMNEETQKIFAMHYMGLDREKFDPNAIAARKGLKLNLNDIAKENNLDLETKSGRKQARTIAAQNRTHVEDTARDSAADASDIDQARLSTLFALSQGARKVGHWEQVTTNLNPETGKYYMMSDDQKIEEVKGEARKQGTRGLIQNMAPHNFVSQVKDEDGKWNYDLDPENMTGYQKRMLSEILTPQMVAEIHHLQTRVPQILSGTINGIGEENAFFDADGMPTSPEKLENWKKLYDQNPNIMRAVWNMAHRGERKDVGRAIPIDEGWEGLAQDNENEKANKEKREPINLKKKVKEAEVPDVKKVATEMDSDVSKKIEAGEEFEMGGHTYRKSKGVGADKKPVWQKLKDGKQVDTLTQDKVVEEKNAKVAAVKGLDIDMGSIEEAIGENISDITVGMDLAGMEEALGKISGELERGAMATVESLSDLTKSFGGVVNKLSDSIVKISDPGKRDSLEKTLGDLKSGMKNAGEGQIQDPISQQRLLHIMSKILKAMKAENKPKGSAGSPSGTGASAEKGENKERGGKTDRAVDEEKGKGEQS